jgi:GH24 family phage-related lysozyme (muramidase)
MEADMENRFLEMDSYLKQISGKSGCLKPGRSTKGSVGYANGATGLAASLSTGWAKAMAVQDRVLVILIENGGIDLGIPALVDKLLAAVPGASLIPDSSRQALIQQIKETITKLTDSALESAELNINRYTAAKPGLYGDVVTLRDGTASYSDLKSKLIALSEEGRIIDLFILTHGSDNFISVAGGIDDQKIRDIKTANGKPLSIRSVYMMNCVGSSLNQAWIAAGAKVSAGALRNNYLPEPTMFFFWQNWQEGQPFESAVTSAYRKTINLMNEAVRGFLRLLPIPGIDSIANSIDFKNFDFVKDSAPVIQGQQSITVSSDDLNFSQSLSSGLATTVLPVRLLRSLSLTPSLAQSDPTSQTGSMTVSQQGIDFIKGWESFRAKMYNDPVGHCTIGYGTLLHHGNCDGRTSEHPYVNDVSEAEATQLLAQEVSGIQQTINSSVTVPLNQNQNDSLVSFVYNIGTGGFRKSTLLKLLNQGNYSAVPTEIKKWTKARQNGKLIDLPGLVRRREAEAELFQKSSPETAQSLSQFSIAHSYVFRSPSTIATQLSNYSLAQNPAAAAITIADAAQIGLASISIVQAQVSASQGTFTLSYDKAQRLLTTEARMQMPGSQSSKQSYSQRLLYIGIGAVNAAEADVIIEWEGNPYGEIGTPIIRRNLSTSTEWSKSSANITITKVDRIPLPNTDPRTWPITYSYEGTYDPYGNGYFEFSGEFEINAFGGLKFTRHEVVSRSLADWAIGGSPENKVQKGQDIIVPVPEIPKEQMDYLRTKLP